MRITALIENTSSDERIAPEHGLSLYIETGGHRILFDMGQSGRFARNAEILGVDLSAVDIAVVSHGHYDHGGGLEKFLETNGEAPVYISRFAFQPHYNGDGKFIGLDPSLAEREQLVFTGDEYAVARGLTLYTCNARPRKYADGVSRFSMFAEGRRLPDPFYHEQYLAIEEDGKRTLVSGCSHKGVLNLVEWFRPDVLVGGFHFLKHPLDGTLADAAKRLHACRTDFYTCHCTGTEPYQFMKQYMDRLSYLSAGQTVTV